MKQRPRYFDPVSPDITEMLNIHLASQLYRLNIGAADGLEVALVPWGTGWN